MTGLGFPAYLTALTILSSWPWIVSFPAIT
jgi:hypothetical protein